MTIWTAVAMKDFDYETETGRGIPIPGLNITQNIGNGTEPRLISTTVTGRMLGAGWLLYLASLILNHNFYNMHPSSPKMWTWGAGEELKVWTPPEETQDQDEGEFVSKIVKPKSEVQKSREQDEVF